MRGRGPLHYYFNDHIIFTLVGNTPHVRCTDCYYYYIIQNSFLFFNTLDAFHVIFTLRRNVRVTPQTSPIL